MDENYFDVIVLGTGLVESTLAAALSKAGVKVAHVDVNRYYGGDEASLSVDELVQWVDDTLSGLSPLSRYSHPIREVQDGLSQSRYYSISLCPSVIPSTGPIISSLISSGVSKYGGFRLVDTVGIYDAASGTVKSVPGSKEDVFKSKAISLVDKRRIMRFLAFAMGDFEDKQELEGKRDMPFLDFLKSVFALNNDVSSAIAYALAYCTLPTEPTLPALIRLRRYLRSAGRYGPSPFLVGHYGGTGEIAQGFCRAAAVSGAIYILGRRISSIVPPAPENESNNPLYTVNIEDVPDSLFCKLLICSPSMSHHLPLNVRQLLPTSMITDASQTSVVARGVAIIDFPISFAPAGPAPSDSEPQLEGESRLVDTGILVFPPSSLPGGSTRAAGLVFMTGEGSMSAPRGKTIIYIALPVESENVPSPETLLKPYLDAVLSLAVSGSAGQPLLTVFYLERAPPTPTPEPASMCFVTPAVYNERLPEAPDMAAVHAEGAFWKAVQLLRTRSANLGSTPTSFWPPATGQESEAEEEW